MAVAGEVAVNIVARTGQLERGLNRARSQLSLFGQSAEGAMASFRGLAGAASVVGTVLAGTAYAWKRTINSIDELNDQAIKLNATYNGLAELQYIAKLNGTEFGVLSAALGAMNVKLGEAAEAGKGAAFDAFTKLGLKINQLTEMKAEDAFEAIAGKLAGLSSATERAALAVDIFGKAGKQIMPVLNEGSSGLAQMRREAEALGLTLGQDVVKNVAKFNDEWDRAKMSLGGRLKRLAAQPWLMEAGVGLMQSWNSTNNPYQFNNNPAAFFSNTGIQASAASQAERNAFKPEYRPTAEASPAMKNMFRSAAEGIVGAIRKADAAFAGSGISDRIYEGTQWLARTQTRMEMRQAAYDMVESRIENLRSGGVSVGVNRAVDARTGEGVAYRAQLKRQEEQNELLERMVLPLEQMRDKIVKEGIIPTEVWTIP